MDLGFQGRLIWGSTRRKGKAEFLLSFFTKGSKRKLLVKRSDLGGL